ncbi:hypothetical protein A6K41_06140 [Listeria monocytogenes]|uniref:hypothetical protein n=1 Tax=Listeria monocytogenes TaxID=1639 RepID=UPI0009AC7971|nr:hypothetical protein [Listeria monocytogenes]AQZ43486.1 hypothetical protein A6K41_06140 [Listeria monocytogenes]
MDNVILTKNSRKLLKSMVDSGKESFNINELPKISGMDMKDIETELSYLREHGLVSYKIFYYITITTAGIKMFDIKKEKNKSFFVTSIIIPFGVSVVTSIVVFWINYWLTKQFLK